MNDPSSLADRIAIEECIYMYAHLLDSQQFHRIADEVFTEDGDIDFGGQRVHGRAEIEATVLGYTGVLKGCSHNISNVIIEVTGDEARATSKVTAWHWFQREDGDEYAPSDLLAVGGYQDRLRRTSMGWRIYQRRGVNFGTGVGVGDVPLELRPVFDGMRGRLPDWP
jgi:hypothetical protein